MVLEIHPTHLSLWDSKKHYPMLFVMCMHMVCIQALLLRQAHRTLSGKD